ncbi:MAG: 16S rRNA (guanine(527)-N(7))-methyltransferase RsmG [Burkholderiales bacterium]|nr:16S rRNA (guanine(527)-N(7))-methyltransferase RsmG [Burkholderiales bacterium]
MAIEELQGGLDALGLRLPAEATASLWRYLGLIAKWNKVYNLTAIRDPERMVVEHLLDCLAIIPHVRPDRILDIGTGAGLPGIPLAIARPRWRVTLLDSSHKRCTFLRQAAIELGLGNIEVACARAESYRPAKLFDTVVSRAFAETQQFARVGAGKLAAGGALLAMKGLYPHEELAQLPAAVALQGVVALDVPGLAARRHLVLMTAA